MCFLSFFAVKKNKKFRKNYEISPAKRREGRIIIQTTFGLFVSSKIKVQNVKLWNLPLADRFLESEKGEKKHISILEYQEIRKLTPTVSLSRLNKAWERDEKSKTKPIST